MDISERFFRGDYLALVRDYADSSNSKVLSNRDRAYIIGALVFVGRRSDAESEFSQNFGNVDFDEAVIARFFLGVGACRDSDYSEARRLFGVNWRKRHSLKSQNTEFWIYQGFGFYRNFCSRFAKSILWAERAWRLAYDLKFKFGMLLAADLRGHGLIQIGQVAKGLKSLEMAFEYSKQLGQGGVSTALEMSMLCYRAMHGLVNSNTLIERWSKLKAEDTYSRSNLALEIVRSLILEGQGHLASQWLERAAKEIFQFGHRRQKSTYLFREAFLAYLSGSDPEPILDEALTLLEDDADLLLRLEIQGLRLKFIEEQRRETIDLKNEVLRLTQLTGRAIGYRQIGLASRLQKTDDLVGRTIDQMKANPDSIEIALQVVARGWNYVLRPYVYQVSQTVLNVGLIPERLIIAVGAELYVSQEIVTPTLKRILMILGRGRCSKQDLVEMVWGYTYDPARHDTLLYTSIHRLRKLLGRYETLLEAHEGLYQWVKPVHIRILPRKTVENLSFIEEKSTDLNVRQMRTLEFLTRIDEINIEKYSSTFGVSKITANRDLTELVKKRLVKRLGRARATCYVLVKANSEVQ